MEKINGTPADLQKLSKKLDEETLTDVLKQYSDQDDIKLKNYTLKYKSADGGSFMSDLTHIGIQGSSPKTKKTYSLNVVLKAMPPNISRRKTFRLTHFYRNEVTFYSKVLAKLLDFQKKKNPKIPFAEIPRFYKADVDGENDYVMLEDLSVTSFRSVDRRKCLDFQHCEKVLKCLGRFHALSFAMKDQEPEEFQSIASSLKESYYRDDKKDWNGGVMKLTLDASYEAVSKEYPISIYKDKMKELCNGPVYDKAANCMKPTNPHSVIIHGDAWAQNFLFLYDDSSTGSVKDVQMIDFQMSCCANPVCDISCFLYSATDKQFRESNINDLLTTYYQSLHDFIQELGSDPEKLYPYSTFEKEIEQFSCVGFIMSCEAVAFSMLNDDELPNLDWNKGEDPVLLHNVLALPPITEKSTTKRLAENVVYAVENHHI